MLQIKMHAEEHCRDYNPIHCLNQVMYLEGEFMIRKGYICA